MLGSEYLPKMAIIVYQSNGEDQEYYLERRKIRAGKMGSGVALTRKCITELFKAVAEDDANLDYGIHGKIPTNLLYADMADGRAKLVWWTAPAKRRVFFSGSLGIPDGEINVPGLLFVTDNGKLAMYAFKGKRPKNRLYRAPFMNVSDEYVCLGNAQVAKPRETTFKNLIQYWEELFWRSEFSHILGGNPVKGNLSVLTKRLIATGEKFPSDQLVPSAHTLKDFVK